jgi:uncharacterized integral membrane protein (TIGR00698 family)
MALTLHPSTREATRGRASRSSTLVGAGALATITAIATVAGRVWPVVGAPVIAVVFGVLASRIVARRAATESGVIAFAKGRLLQLAIVLLGAQLSLRELADVGLRSLPVMLATLAMCLAAARVVGRKLGVDRDLRVLIGAGTGICGASAIAAVSSTIRPRQSDVAYAISTIFLFNVAAVLIFPPIGHLLGMSQQSFGLFAGTAVNDTSSVIAAAQTFGSAAEQHAVVVKLVRTLMIVPICLWLSTRNRDAAGPHEQRVGALRRATRLVPAFLVAFVAVVALNSAGLVPAGLHTLVADTAPMLVTAALAAIGLSVDGRALRSTGARPLLLGLALWLVVSATSLALQQL